jgi:isopenicillin N synthase-like dioxygenase
MPLDTVPIIDISPFLSGDPEGRKAVAAAVAKACKEIGFFAITGHGVEQNLIEDLREASHSFFEQPEAIKRQYVHPVPDTPRGHRVMQGESLGKTVRADALPDLKEFYHYGPQQWPDDPYFTGPEGSQYFIPNIWPDEPAAFREICLAYYRELERLLGDLGRIAALALDLPENWFEDKFDKHVTAVRLNYYPLLADAPPSGQIRAGEHNDYGFFTILMGEDEAGGLQVRTRSGNWIDVETRPEFFIINIGDLLMRWTNDTWLSNMHRVVNPPVDSKPTRGRLSVGFFSQPNYDALIECIPSCTGPENPAKYEPVESGKYRDLKYDQGNAVGETKSVPADA